MVGCGQTSAKWLPSTMPSPLSTRSNVSRERRSSAFVREDYEENIHVPLIIAHPAAKVAVGASHLTMICRKGDDCIPPQIRLVHHIRNLLNIAITVSNGVQIVVVVDRPHVLTVGWDCAGPAGVNVKQFSSEATSAFA